MDPDANLTELRRLVSGVLQDPAYEPVAVRTAELFEALDRWISRGGFLPAAWRMNDENKEHE